MKKLKKCENGICLDMDFTLKVFTDFVKSKLGESLEENELNRIVDYAQAIAETMKETIGTDEEGQPQEFELKATCTALYFVIEATIAALLDTYPEIFGDEERVLMEYSPVGRVS